MHLPQQPPPPLALPVQPKARCTGADDMKGFINSLLRGFRPLIVDFQEEHKRYRQRNRPARTTTATSTTTASSRKISSSGTAATTTTTRSSSLTRISPPTTALSTSTNMSAASSSVARGALIVLEGLDRVGKTTLASKLVDHMKRTKRPVSQYRFPDRSTEVGQVIDKFLRGKLKFDNDKAVHVLFNLNRLELSTKIEQTLEQGTTVIVDRYSYSGIAYSCAKKGLDMNWCCQYERGLPKPDLVIYLELPKEVQYRREGFGDERFETEEMQERVRSCYERLMEISLEDWIRINVDHKSPDQVLAEVIIPVKRCLDKCANKDLGVLDFKAT